MFYGLYRSYEKFGTVPANFWSNQMRLKRKSAAAAMTLPEVMVAVLLLGVFCASVFELNAVCLRYIDASKESIAAVQTVHDRCEVLRNLSFTDLTTANTVQSLLATPPNGSDFCKKATEIIKISAYPTPNGVTQFTRTPDGTVTTNSTATTLGTSLVQVDVSTSWNMLGGRARSETTSTIISNGTKK
ncbi:MAG TPA: hypothetical protein VH170_08240 [Chthoniobacterales bacterium]|jgi:Tfp pilus assembly protein PilV|nr:hypothetical protein [Chthoniobacterales bacterium]